METIRIWQAPVTTKRVAIVLTVLIMIMLLVGGTHAGRVTSSSGGIGSSQSGGGIGSASRAGAAGHSASAEVRIEETLADPFPFPQTSGSFDITTSGEEEMTDDIVTVRAAADELHITGELVPGVVAGSTVEAHAVVRAEGDETPGTGVFVDSEIDAGVTLDLLPGARGKATASASGRATGSGTYLGMEVSSEADGSIDVEAEAEGSTMNGAYADGWGYLDGYAYLEDNGQYLQVFSDIYADLELDYDAGGEVITSGSAASSADGPDLSGRSDAHAPLAVEGKAFGDEGFDAWAQVEGYQEHEAATDAHESWALISSEVILVSSEDTFSARGEASASGKASASGQDDGIPLPFAISSMENTVKGSVGATAEQDGEGMTDAYGGLESWTYLNYNEIFYSTESFDPADPEAYSSYFELDSTGLLYDSAGVSGGVILDASSDNYEAEATATADGKTGSDSAYGFHSSETSAGGDTAVEIHLDGWTGIVSEAEIYAANALDNTVTSITGTLNPVVMSVSTLNTGGDWFGSSDDFSGKATADGKARASATYSNGLPFATAGTSADGRVSGMASGSEIAGLFTAGSGADDSFVTLDDASISTDGFLTADAGLSVFNQGGIATLEGLSFSNSASGKAGSSGDITFLNAMYTGKADVSGKVSAVSRTSAPGEWFSGAMEHGAGRCYYDSTEDDRFAKSLTEAVAVAGEEGMGPDWTSGQKVSFSGAKISAGGSVDVFGDFRLESKSTLAGTGTVDLKASGDTDSWASARINSRAIARHDDATEFDLGRIDAYYQAYFSGLDEAAQTAKIQVSGATITDRVVVTDQDGSVVDSSEDASLSLSKGTSKIEVNTGSNKVSITFPYVNPKISGHVDVGDPDVGQQVQTQTENSLTAPANTAWSRWRAAVSTNQALPVPPLPPQP